MSNNYKRLLITGGAGFIGGALIRRLLSNKEYKIFNIDKFSYASDLTGILKTKGAEDRHFFYKLDLRDKVALKNAFNEIQPDLIINFAAESHVDRSIDNPSNFIESNIMGTFNLLECARNYWENLNKNKKSVFRFHHISTDEVYGSLGMEGKFNESTKYSPRSPYSASKASSDHLVSSWFHTYGLPIVITNCSNNFGPYQFPEKFIPLSILKAFKGEEIPLYGDGSNIRDWLFVEDHIDAILLVALKGKIGESYCIGGYGEKTNKEVVNSVCNLMDKYYPKPYSHLSLIKNVKDRPGHDQRYAIDSSLIKKEFGWIPKIDFDQGILITLKWYLENIDWCNKILKQSGYSGERLGN